MRRSKSGKCPEIKRAQSEPNGVLRQALSSDDKVFRDACSILKSMCHAKRVEAGVFLFGLQRHYCENYARLILIADALEWFACPETVQALAAELRRVPGSNSTRRYLRRVIDALKALPAKLTAETIQSLAADPLVGARLRRHLKELNHDDAW